MVSLCSQKLSMLLSFFSALPCGTLHSYLPSNFPPLTEAIVVRVRHVKFSSRPLSLPLFDIFQITFVRCPFSLSFRLNWYSTVYGFFPNLNSVSSMSLPKQFVEKMQFTGVDVS